MNDTVSSFRDAPADDWRVLSALFPDATTEFRHHMGLARADTCEFYAPTQNGDALLAERARILSSPGADRYVISHAEGKEALDEFADLIVTMATDAAETSVSSVRRQLGLQLEPDWLLLAPPDWRVVAACVCFPTRWSLEGKTLERLVDIHGIVPQLNEELGRKIETFFGKLKQGEGWGRANWGLSSSRQLDQHPALPYEPLREDHPLGEIQIRVERQHLCKLPRTAAMSFGIRVVNFPLVDVLERPAILAGLKHRLQTMPEEVARYKGIPPNLWRRL